MKETNFDSSDIGREDEEHRQGWVLILVVSVQNLNDCFQIFVVKDHVDAVILSSGLVVGISLDFG